MSGRVGRWTVAAMVGAALVATGVLGLGAGSGAGPGAARAAFAQGAATLRYVVAEGSEVRYRVREQLVGLSLPNDAVGATRAIEGGLALDAQGRVVADGSRFTVDLRTLRSDEARRDNYLRRNTLETERFPAVVFVPTELRGLPAPPPGSGTATFTLVGDLTVRDVTRRVQWAATGTFDGPAVSVKARTAFPFGEFGLRQPRVPVVLSVEDTIRLEADLVLRRAS